MYLIIVFILMILMVILGIYGYSKKEGFNQSLVDVLPIQISSDNSTITIPNQIQGNKGNDITFVGNIQAPTGTTDNIKANGDSTFHQLTVNGDSQLNQTTIKGNTKITGSNLFELGANMGKSKTENGTLGYKTLLDTSALNIVGADMGGSRNVHVWDNVEIAQNLHVNGSIKLGTEKNYWTIRTRSDGRLEFLYKETGQEDFGNDVGHILMDPVGNLWLSRSSYRGWVADNLQAINNKGV